MVVLELSDKGHTPVHAVMPGLVPGIHVFLQSRCKDVDGRGKPRHDDDLNNCKRNASTIAELSAAVIRPSVLADRRKTAREKSCRRATAAARPRRSGLCG